MPTRMAGRSAAPEALQAVQTLKTQQTVWDVRARLDENFRSVEALLREMEMAADPKLRLAAAAELRQHIARAEKTLETAARAEAVRAFEEIVLGALEAASATVRRKVMDALNARAGIERECGAAEAAEAAETAGSDGRPERDAPVVLRSDGAAVRE